VSCGPDPAGGCLSRLARASGGRLPQELFWRPVVRLKLLWRARRVEIACRYAGTGAVGREGPRTGWPAGSSPVTRAAAAPNPNNMRGREM
jgi:hypothetical protein